jgi:hypothetical protein
MPDLREFRQKCRAQPIMSKRGFFPTEMFVTMNRDKQCAPIHCHKKCGEQGEFLPAVTSGPFEMKLRQSVFTGSILSRRDNLFIVAVTFNNNLPKRVDGYKGTEKSIYLPKVFLCRTAFWADPVCRDLLPRSPWFNTTLIVSFCRIINIPTGTFPLLHLILL